MSIRMIAACAVLIGAALPAAAQTSLTIDGKENSVPTPEGFCATGKVVDAYRAAQARINPSSIPDVVMVRCDAASFDFNFYAVKLTDDSVPSRAAFLADLRATMPAAKASGNVLPEGATEALASRLSDVLGRKMEMHGGMMPVDVDDSCGYLAGTLQFSAEGGRSVTATGIGCATAIGTHVLYVFRYFPGADTKAAIATLPELKAIADGIRPVH